MKFGLKNMTPYWGLSWTCRTLKILVLICPKKKNSVLVASPGNNWGGLTSNLSHSQILGFSRSRRNNGVDVFSGLAKRRRVGAPPRWRRLRLQAQEEAPARRPRGPGPTASVRRRSPGGHRGPPERVEGEEFAEAENSVSGRDWALGTLVE